LSDSTFTLSQIEGKCLVQKVGDDRKDDKIVNVDDIKLKRTNDLIKKIKTEISNVQATKGSNQILTNRTYVIVRFNIYTVTHFLLIVRFEIHVT
jgi:hypothetical protein